MNEEKRIDILSSLQNCINALGGMNLRVDQEREGNTARAVIRTLYEVKEEVKRREAEAADQAAAQAEPPKTEE